MYPKVLAPFDPVTIPCLHLLVLSKFPSPPLPSFPALEGGLPSFPSLPSTHFPPCPPLQNILREWDVPGDLEAALQWDNGKTYFFKEGGYWRFNDRLADRWPRRKIVLQMGYSLKE